MEALKNKTVHSRLINLSEVAEDRLFFNIPIYQRLYVWGYTQIKALFEDLHNTFIAQDELFYLGGVIVVKNDNSPGMYDLIDGQQRFTTLWLLSIVLGHDLKKYVTNNGQKSGQIRLNFSIREEATEYFKDLIYEREITKSDKLAELSQIHFALTLLKSLITDKFENEVQLKNFASFIFRQVKLIMTEVPSNTDLNKLFELLNNRGEQLQHHEILKAILLSKIENPTERINYGLLWDACADMEEYVEKNIRKSTGLDTAHYYQTDNLANAETILSVLNGQSKSHKEPEKTNLLDVLNSSSEAEENIEEGGLNETPEGQSSIISFPLLLLHTLRIYRHKKSRRDIPRIKEKELLETFEKKFLRAIPEEKESETEVKQLIELLWQVRYNFDKYVIKWVMYSTEKIHAIKTISRQKNSNGKYNLQRLLPEEVTELEMLQAMLYHSQELTTHYWLTPFLYKTLKINNKDQLFNYLQRLDNRLFSSTHDDTLIKRTRKEMKGWKEKPNIDYSIINKSLGLKFPRYWFYKLEFVLWYLFRKKEEYQNWRNFRITSKSSIEHISPQSPRKEDDDKVSASLLNSFGNLALVTKSINSEYSNLPYNEKRQRFLNRNKERVDSLKMDLIYRSEKWGDQQAIDHQEFILKKLSEYFNKTGS